MPKWITDGTTTIGPMRVYGVKKPYICIQDEKSTVCYEQFRNDTAADEFIERLAELFNIKEEREEDG